MFSFPATRLRLAVVAAAAITLAACSGSSATTDAPVTQPVSTATETERAPDVPNAALVGATNLIQNPSLETAGASSTPASWAKMYWGLVTPVYSYPVTGHTGRGASVTLLLPTNGDARWQPAAVPVNAGGKYTYSTWYKATTASSIIAEYTNSTGGFSYAQLGTVASTGGQWVQFTTTFTIPTGKTKVAIYQAISRAGVLTIDDVSLTSETVLPPPAPVPTVTLTASPATITAGQSSTLGWSSTDATACTASGAWTGAKATGGSQVVSPTVTSTYTLTCTGPGGSAAKSATVTLGSTPAPTGKFTEGMVSLTFDDAWESQYFNALPILQAAGLKATFYLTTLPIEQGWSLFMTPAAVLDIAAKGHEIAGHTLLHPDLNTISIDSVRTEVTVSKTYLQTLTGKTVTSFAYPYGNSTPAIQTLLEQVGYTSATTVNYSQQVLTTTPKYTMNRMCVEPLNTVAVFKAQIDAAIANKTWFILCFHDVKTGGDNISITPADFQAIVDYIKAKAVKVVTVAQGRALMAP